MSHKCPNCNEKLNYKNIFSISFTQASLCSNCDAKLVLKNPKSKDFLFFIFAVIVGKFTIDKMLINQFTFSLVGLITILIGSIFWIKSWNVVLDNKKV